MVISADFEKQKQYFDKKNYCFVSISLYCNIACKKCSSDEGLKVTLPNSAFIEKTYIGQSTPSKMQ